MARRGRGNRFEFCTPIAICMQSNFGFTYAEIGEAFGCSQSTVQNRLSGVGYESAKRGGSKESRIQQSGNAKQRLFEIWEELGYSDKFEIIGEYTRKVDPIELRCKLCGGTFTRIPESIYKQYSNIRCSNCWIHRDDETVAPRDYQLTQHLVNAYTNGDTVASIAKKYNLDERVVSRLIRESGVAIDCNKAEYNKNSNRQRFKTNDKRIRKEWRDLNNELDNWRRCLKEVRQIQSAKRTKQRLAIVERNIESMQVYEPQIATCKHCGKEWLFWPSRDRYSHHKPQTFCSVRCNNNHHYSRCASNHSHRARKFGVAYESGISLKKIEKRDSGICYLCGGKTNRNDKWITNNGYQVTGSLYPSLDHVIPMARGGGHVFNNVKLAHKSCNELKGTKLLSELQLPFAVPKGGVTS